MNNEKETNNKFIKMMQDIQAAKKNEGENTPNIRTMENLFHIAVNNAGLDEFNDLAEVVLDNSLDFFHTGDALLKLVEFEDLRVRQVLEEVILKNPADIIRSDFDAEQRRMWASDCLFWCYQSEKPISNNVLNILLQDTHPWTRYTAAREAKKTNRINK